MVRHCLEAGKDVFVEKPLALTPQGEELVALAQRTLAPSSMVGHILLYHPAVVKLRQLIQEGALGRILYCYSNRLNMGLIRTEENILWSFAPHDISVILHLLGEEPIAAEADGQSYLTPGVVDVTLSRLTFRSGVTGHIFVSWLHPSKEQRLVVVGTEKMAVFDDTAEKKLLLYPHRVDWASRDAQGRQGGGRRRRVGEGRAAEGRVPSISSIASPTGRRRFPTATKGFAFCSVLDACQQSSKHCAARRPRPPCRPVKSPPPSRSISSTKARYVDQPCTIGKGTQDLALLPRHERGRDRTRIARSAKTSWSARRPSSATA